MLIAEHVGSGESSLEVSDRVPLGERRFGSTSGQCETGTATIHQLAYSGDGHYTTAGVSCPIQALLGREQVGDETRGRSAFHSADSVEVRRHIEPVQTLGHLEEMVVQSMRGILSAR